MSKIEQLVLKAHREQLQADVRQLLDKYLAIAEWGVPEIDEPLAICLIVTAVKELDRVENALAASTQPSQPSQP